MAADLATAWHGLPHAFGKPGLCGKLRQRPEDFQVSEQLSFTPSGDGEHLLLQIRKSGWNTGDVASWLSRALGVKRRSVTFAGRKDRHAVTEQWFGVHLPGRWPDLPELPPGLELLQSTRHGRKLRLGALRANRFRIRLTELQGPREVLHRRLVRIARRGVPNYFGAQRFGIDGGNLAGAERLFRGQRVSDRPLRGLYLSAARALLFNQVLAQRVRRNCWDQALPGDLMTFSGSRSIFPADDTTACDPRIMALDLHPTGPLPGIPGMQPEAAARELEERVLQGHAPMLQVLLDYRLRAERRALRLPVAELGWFEEDGALALSFSLPPGAFATAVIREIIDIV
ncbi:tRNA pseudouridine(13) synthase TruD [Methylonatrum kenyense]|uniref:tRNA pseudouridine(13) synthase TruD n=1 Tax=Methylonatrum kenyense TaxID=455253 RepID=UPI0020C0354F|nr:tRNA pseudouridine(13) synthase TruD [Methylonatrum kenyense]MCK8516402.1 tRNA pseudouridine(13) synthase TruD [Methylonatrum kenyense]